MAIFGRGASGGDVDFFLSGGSNYTQRATVMGVLPENAWVYRFGGRFARWYLSSGTANTKISVWLANGNVPGELLGTSALIGVSNAGSFSGEATLQTAAVASTTQPDSPTETAIAIKGGSKLALGVNVSGAVLLAQMIEAQDSNYDNKYFYNRDASSPTNPFGSVESTHEGNATLYLEYEANVAPTKPVGTAPTGFITDTSPAFTASFVDANEDRGDRLTQYQIQIRRTDTNATIYNNTFSADASEANGHAWEYVGTALPQGIGLEWRVRHADFFTSWSVFSDWKSFQINPGGDVDYSGPALTRGKVHDTTPDPGSFTYSHIASLAGDAYMVQVVNATGGVVKGPISNLRTIANNSTQVVTYAQTGFTALSRGVSYAFEFAVRDSGGVWSPFDRGAFFTVNQLPNVPSSISPSGGAAFTTKPKITAIATDPDDVPAPTGVLVAHFSLRNAASTFTTSGFGTYNTTTKRFEWTPSGTLALDTYYVKARAGDSEGYSAYSGESSFVIANGPAITILTPVDGSTIDTNQPVISWTTTNPKSYFVDLYNADTEEFLTGSGTVLSSSTSQAWTPPSGYILEGMQLRAVIRVTDTNNLTNTAEVYFNVDYPDILPSPGFAVSAYMVEGDRDPTAVQISWEIHPDDDPATFVEYVVTRTSNPVANPLARIGVDEGVVIVARIPNFESTMAIDYFPASKRTYTYTLHRVILQGSEFKPSLSVSADMTVEFRDCVIASATRGGDVRTALKYQTDAKIDPKDDATFMIAWGEKEPTAFVGSTDYDTTKLTFALVNDGALRADKALNELESLRQKRETVCYRDNRGYKVFGYLTSTTDYRPLGMYEVDVNLTEVNFPEGY